ncbi:MAG: hypothetical protein HON76_10490 [Candidatus Scalindua sp.]|jgi:hypothetical protein|nr:hypothetical protein [Candidatus Scalindua sp.]MBT5306772.1 hypothetical protein [Candidatus Scalindua sp.]MBT6051062.1 hypothetical protein [Candidatus Scalindua sp.]MBT6229399.1 hypothetical protein [Candidatus Scalindua sp.]MBT6562941.1 hypothetical protein [Candidatus Scalindua sp.]
MLISGKSKFVKSPFTSEDELKKMVIENADYFFAPSSFCLSRELISDKDGFEVFTDGFAVDIANRQWFIVNAALAKHNVWSHIVPQVVKQLVAAGQSTTKQLIIELIIQQISEDKNIMKKFNDEGYGKEDEGVFLNEIRGVLGEVFGKSPIIGMPIDSISNDLRDWAETLKTKVKMSVVRKYVESGNSENIIYEIPEEDQTGQETTEGGNGHSKNTESAKITKESLNSREIYLTKKRK